jgi:methylated-DNA-[protein]-cysteine S-methyltransferase
VVLTRHAVEHLLHTSGRGRRGGGSAKPWSAWACKPPKRRSRRRVLRRWPEAREETPPAAVQQAIDGVVALLSGAAVDLSTVPLDMERVPTFDRRVYEIARAIPPGHTLTYGDIAARLGDPGAAREVGQALGRNPFAVIVPCHRVIAAGGKTGGFSATGGVTTKLRLLEIERARRAASRPCSTRTRRSRGCNAAGSGWSTAKKVARYLLFSSPIPCFDRDGHSFVST